MSANENPIYAIGKNRKIIAGSFLPNGSSALVASGVLGAGFTVAYTSTGLYTVTLSQKWLRLLAASLTLQATTILGNHLEIGVTDVSGAKTIQIRSTGPTNSSTTTPIVTDTAADAGNRIHFVFIMSQDTVQT